MEIGDIVIVKQENVPPARWWMARVMETYPGEDGLVRTVKIKHMGSEYLRPIHKLGVLLPSKDETRPLVEERGDSTITDQGTPHQGEKNNSSV